MTQPLGNRVKIVVGRKKPFYPKYVLLGETTVLKFYDYVDGLAQYIASKGGWTVLACYRGDGRLFTLPDKVHPMLSEKHLEGITLVEYNRG